MPATQVALVAVTALLEVVLMGGGWSRGRPRKAQCRGSAAVVECPLSSCSCRSTLSQPVGALGSLAEGLETRGEACWDLAARGV